MTLGRTRSLVLVGMLVLQVGRAEADPWDRPKLPDGSSATLSELAHGSNELHDLKGASGAPDQDWFRISQKPYASYEVVVDAATGDPTPIRLERIAADGATVLQTGVAVGTGAVRSLRWANETASAIDDQFVRVTSGGCGKDCKVDDVYRVRAFDTTYAGPRFNNLGTQVTVLVLQNPTDGAVAGNVRYWNAAGDLVGTSPFALAPKQLAVLATQVVVPALSGSVTIAHDGRYGGLTGKLSGLEPATGFNFETLITPRPY